MNLFRLEKLTKTYEDRVVLDIPRLEIEEKRIVALLGPNGAGKTTLMNILAFLESPTGGKIFYRNEPVRLTGTMAHALRRKVVMVNQHPILFTTTVFKNLEFGLKIRKIPAKKRNSIIEETLELVGMLAFASAPARGLSGGETQRVALARALVLSPEILLCDEPTSSVDVENQAIIVNLFRELNAAKQMSLLFTTHDRSLAASLAHQTLTLDHGRLMDTAFENIFSATIQYSKDGPLRYGLSPDISLISAATMDAHTKHKTRVFINPAEIQILSNNGSHHGENVVKGVVSQIAKENSKIKIGVDAGIWFTLTIAEEEYKSKRIIIGDTLSFGIPPEAVRPVS